MELQEDAKEFLALIAYNYLRFGRWNDARVIFELLKNLYPSETLFSKSLCFACLQTGDYERVVQECERLLDHAKEWEEQKIGWILKSKALWRLGQADRARECMERLLRTVQHHQVPRQAPTDQGNKSG